MGIIEHMKIITHIRIIVMYLKNATTFRNGSFLLHKESYKAVTESNQAIKLDSSKFSLTFPVYNEIVEKLSFEINNLLEMLEYTKFLWNVEYIASMKVVASSLEKINQHIKNLNSYPPFKREGFQFELII